MWYRSSSLILAAALAAVGFVDHARAALIAEWSFDNSANVGIATVGSSLTAVDGATYTVSGKIGGALSLDGSSGYLHLTGDVLPTNVPVGDSSYTIAAWIKTSTYYTDYKLTTIVGWGNPTTGQDNVFRPNGLPDGGDGLTNASWGQAYDITRLGTVTNGQWHFVAVTYDSGTSTKQLYLDGVALGAPMVLSSDVAVGSGNFRIGSTGEGNYFNGLLDDVRIYDNALSSNEIAAIASVPEPGAWLLLATGLLTCGWRRRS